MEHGAQAVGTHREQRREDEPQADGGRAAQEGRTPKESVGSY
jgi:hypothetical protein